MDTYEDYLTQRNALTVESMHQIHMEMIEEIGTDQDALELYQDLLEAATKYAAIRASWPLMSREEKMDKDARRTSCHDSAITHFNMLSRYLKQQGKAVVWRDKLGYIEDDPELRKTIGDFACYLVFISSINAR